jgi:hypothetical protein
LAKSEGRDNIREGIRVFFLVVHFVFQFLVNTRLVEDSGNKMCKEE